MRKIIAFGIAAGLALAAIVTWATATTHSKDHVNASAALVSPITPSELMKNSKGLPRQQYDAH
jgi:hypothetical protein